MVSVSRYIFKSILQYLISWYGFDLAYSLALASFRKIPRDVDSVDVWTTFNIFFNLNILAFLAIKLM